MQSFYLAIIGAGILGYLGVDALDLPAPAWSGACTIKGNVSVNSGERIYHVPGQKFYAETKISPNMVSAGSALKQKPALLGGGRRLIRLDHPG